MRIHHSVVLGTIGGISMGAFLTAMLGSCVGDDTSSVASNDASVEGPAPGRPDASIDSSPPRPDAGSDAAIAPVFLTHFDLAAGQQPEGVWVLGAGTDAGTLTPIVGFAPLATLVTVNSAGAPAPFGTLGTASGTFTLGITADGADNIYVGIGVGGPAPNLPAPGVYKFPKEGGTGTVFSAAADATPAMNFPNGLDFLGSDLFVADSGGTIFKIAPTGVATAWLTHPLLAPDMTACGGFPFAIGANGLAHDASAFYVANTDFGRLVRIPIQGDGTAGTPSVVVENCDLLGIDGVAFDAQENSLLVAVNIKNRIERISLTGQRTTLASGAPLDAPASLFIESTSSGRRLLVTNAAFFSAAAGQPGLLALPLP